MAAVGTEGVYAWSFAATPIRETAMNPTAADYEQAIDTAFRHGKNHFYPEWIKSYAQELAAARQTDSVEKVIADMRSLICSHCRIDDVDVDHFAARLEALGK